MQRQRRADAEDIQDVLGPSDRSHLRELTCVGCAQRGKTRVLGLLRVSPNAVTLLTDDRPRHRLGAALGRLLLRKRSPVAVTPLPAILSCKRGHTRLVTATTLNRLVTRSPDGFPVYL